MKEDDHDPFLRSKHEEEKCLIFSLSTCHAKGFCVHWTGFFFYELSAWWCKLAMLIVSPRINKELLLLLLLLQLSL